MPTFAAVKSVAFAAAAVILLYISRGALRTPGSHGSYRVLAWLAILALTFLNLEHWFDEPFALRQVISWLSLGLSLFLVTHGTWLLLRGGKPAGTRTDASLLRMEQTTSLVTAGAYRYIRHPLYSSLLFLAWGVFLKSPSWTGGGLFVLTTLLLTATAKAEETENLRYFGTAYSDYMRHTKRFIPFTF